MTVNITPTPAPLPGVVVIPADGESVNSASVAQYVQTLANALEYGAEAALVWQDLTGPSAHNAAYDGTFRTTGDLIAERAGGRLVGKRQVELYSMPDSNQTVVGKNYDIISAPTGVQTADRTLTLDATGSFGGDVLEVHTLNITWGLSITGDISTGTIFIKCTGSSRSGVKFVLKSGVFTPVAYYVGNT